FPCEKLGGHINLLRILKDNDLALENARNAIHALEKSRADIQKLIETRTPNKFGDVTEFFMRIPKLQGATRAGSGVVLWAEGE
ncbi:hypothetical protein BGX30_005817, partial [Mortierella sp. GBA39]